MNPFASFEVEPAGEGKSAVVRGVNWSLVTHYETTPQGGALVFFIGGAQMPIPRAAWDSVGKGFALPTQEPPATQAPKS